MLDIKTAVIRDNDKNYAKNGEEYCDEYLSESVKVFSDQDNERYTFEVCIYNDNKAICDKEFSGGKIQKLPLYYMLSNKTKSALQLTEKN